LDLEFETGVGDLKFSTGSMQCRQIVAEWVPVGMCEVEAGYGLWWVHRGWTLLRSSSVVRYQLPDMKALSALTKFLVCFYQSAPLSATEN
jgi:hypothetical protein